MKISIAMTTYNGQDYLLKQLESLSRQTNTVDEVIIVDDCSQDSTVSLLQDFKRKSSLNIKIYQNEKNLAYTQNFAKALSLCIGELVFLADQDDVWFEDKIEYMMNLALSHPEKKLFMCDAEIVDKGLNRTQITKQSQLKQLGLDNSRFVTGCCIAIKKDFLTQLLPIPQGFIGHDNWMVNIADKLNLRYVDARVCQLYRRHGENESMSRSSSIVKISLFGKLELGYVRLLRKLSLKTWIEYFKRRELINKKVKGLKKLL